jgi:hypothetical protein
MTPHVVVLVALVCLACRSVVLVGASDRIQPNPLITQVEIRQCRQRGDRATFTTTDIHAQAFR